MNGWTATKIDRLGQPGPSETEFVIADMKVSAQGALNFRVNIQTSVTAGQITYKLQQKIGQTYTDLGSSSAVVNSDETISIKKTAYLAADAADLPLGSTLRLVGTTDASWDGTIERLEHLQGL